MPKKNIRCELLHWYNYNVDEVVTEKTIASTDPKAKLYHIPLGRDCWKDWIENVIKPNVNKYRLIDEGHIVNEALGSIIT